MSNIAHAYSDRQARRFLLLRCFIRSKTVLAMSEATMPNPIDRAKRDLERLDAVISQAETTIRRAKAEREEVAAFIRLYNRYTSGEGRAEPLSRAVGARMSRKEVIATAAASMVREHGAPMQLDPLYDGLVERGIEIGGEDKRQRLSQILSRHHHFISLPNRRGWWLKELPLPPKDDEPPPEGANGSVVGEDDDAQPSPPSLWTTP